MTVLPPGLAVLIGDWDPDPRNAGERFTPAPQTAPEPPRPLIPPPPWAADAADPEQEDWPGPAESIPPKTDR